MSRRFAILYKGQRHETIFLLTTITRVTRGNFSSYSKCSCVFLFCLFSPPILDGPYRGSVQNILYNETILSVSRTFALLCKGHVTWDNFSSNSQCNCFVFFIPQPHKPFVLKKVLHVNQRHSKNFKTHLQMFLITDHPYETTPLLPWPQVSPSFHDPRYPLPSMAPGIPFLI